MTGPVKHLQIKQMDDKILYVHVEVCDFYCWISMCDVCTRNTRGRPWSHEAVTFKSLEYITKPNDSTQATIPQWLCINTL